MPHPRAMQSAPGFLLGGLVCTLASPGLRHSVSHSWPVPLKIGAPHSLPFKGPALWESSWTVTPPQCMAFPQTPRRPRACSSLVEDMSLGPRLPLGFQLWLLPPASLLLARGWAGSAAG